MAIKSLPEITLRSNGVPEQGTPGGILSAHGAGPLEGISLADPEDAGDLLPHAETLFDIARRYRQPQADAWTSFMEWARGHGQWDSRRPKWRSRYTANYIFASCFSRAALLTDARPIIRALPRTKKDLRVIQSLVDPLLAYQWERQSMDSSYSESVTGAVILGDYYLHQYWDPTAAEGAGECQTSIVDPAYVFGDPGQLAVNGPDRGEFMFHVEPRSIEWIRRQFPDTGYQVQAEGIPPDFYGSLRPHRRALAMSPVDEKPWYTGLPIIGPLVSRRGEQQSVEPLADIPRALVFCLWIRDPAVEVENEEQETFRESYPNGRRIIYSNGILLTPDKESQQSPHRDGRIPLIHLRNYTWPGDYHGGSDVEQLIEIQREMNLSRARVSDHMNNFTNGKWVVRKNSGVDIQTLSNSPTQVIQPRNMEDVKRMDGMPLPDGVIDYISLQQRDFENISAYQESQQGRIPQRIQSGEAIKELREASQTRVRLTERNLKSAVEEWADFTVELVRDNYDEERLVRVTDERTGVVSFLDVKKNRIPERLDYRAQVASQILRGQQKISTNDAIELYNSGLIDQRAALEAIDFQEVESLLARTDNDKQTLLNLMKSDPAFARAVIETLQSQQTK